MRRLLNDPEHIVEEMLEGYVLAHGKYVKLLENDGRVIVSKAAPVKDKVGIIIGGGSGHEPLFIGYVGEGFADAAVVGNINTSPSPEPCYHAVKAVDSGKGCLFMYGNYAGDVMNFDMAAEMAAADGIRVETVLVTDDVCSSPAISRRRGVAGDFFAFKVAAAKAAAGAGLDEVKAMAERANSYTRSMGVALSAATHPATGKIMFEMADGEMEIGMGIHGEPGVKRGKLETADMVVDQIMPFILRDLPFAKGDEVSVLINGLGGLPLMDLHIIYRQVAWILREEGIKIYNSFVGNYATSMDMIGMSITLMKLDGELKSLLDAPCDTPYCVIA